MSSNAHPPARILIIEDNGMDAFLLQETLKQAGTGPLEITVAGTIKEALAQLGQQKFDVLLSDLSLPDSKGLDTFRHLDATAGDTPIILVTGQEDEALELEAVRAGAQEYIVKGTINGKALWRVISFAIERRSLDLALRESEKRYKRLLNSVTDYIYTVKVEHGRPVATSHGPACMKVTGYTSQEIESDPHLWFRMVHEADQGSVRDQAARVLAGEAVPLEHRLIHKDGSVRWVRNTPVTRLDDQGQLVGYDGLISDITERKRAEEALREVVEDLRKSREELKSAHLQLIQAEKMEIVGRMAAGVAHEVQNPLQILLMSLDYLNQRLTGRDATLEGVLAEMRNAANRADTIIRGLLDFSHSDTFRFTPQQINELVEKALVLVRHNMVKNLITLQTELGPDLPTLELDGVKIEQVLVNLFTNAIDAMPTGGTLKVATRVEWLTETHREPGSREAGHLYAGGKVGVVEVQDTGTGIPEEALRKIFDPFFTTKVTGKGTGLGLAIVRRIVDLHGGKIEIDNRPEGGVRCRLVFKAKE